MSDQFAGKVVLITGGGGGIGKAAARRFLEEGANVVLSGTRASVLEAAQQELDPSGERVAIRAGEVTTRDHAHDLVRWAVERFGGSTCSSTAPASSARCRSSSRPRSTSRRRRTRSSGRRTGSPRRSPPRWPSGGGGAIVNVGSMWAVDAIETTPTSAYSAAQAGRHMLAKNLAIELAPVGIRVNTVALAFVETPPTGGS